MLYNIDCGGKLKNATLTAIFAGIGFLLSLIIGLFSPVYPGVLFLRAFIFAIVFAVLSFCIRFVFGKFVSVADNSSDAVAASDDTPKATGSVVDITLPDEDLPTEDHAPQFKVGSNYQMLNKSDFAPKTISHSTDDLLQGAGASLSAASASTKNIINKDTPPDVVNTAQQTAPVFTPTPLGAATSSETLSTQDASTASVAQSSGESKPSDKTSATPVQATSKHDDALLDELPNIANISAGESDSSGEVLEDTDFSKQGSKTALQKKPTGMENTDTLLMAKAITTVLASDSE